jgi:hypothetical protein
MLFVEPEFSDRVAILWSGLLRNLVALHTTSKMNCKGCGCKLTLLEYQSRSADEAHSSVYRCPFCPLDITKFSNKIRDPHVYLKSSKRVRKKTPLMEHSVYKSSRILSVTSKDISVLQGHEILYARCHNCLDSESRLFKSYSTGPWKDMAVHQGEIRDVGLNVQAILIHTAPSDSKSKDEYIDFEYTVVDGYNVILQDNRARFVCDVGIESDSVLLDTLFIAYTIGFAPVNLMHYLSPMLLGAMSNMNARAYDTTGAVDNEDKFSTKPDGERMWLLHSGSTWLYCRRMDFEIRHWDIDSELVFAEKSSVSPVVDVEFMYTLSPILIDVLQSADGSICPYDRNLEWIQSQMLLLQKNYQYLSLVHVREFFDTYKDACDYTRSVDYPTDGLVAISPNGTDMKKLKPFKSVELRFEEDGRLTTRDGKALFKVTGQNVYSTGDIVEVRFSIQDGAFEVHETFHRPDKALANDDSAVQSVIASCAKPDSDSVLRTMIWRWSNKLRFYLYSRANSFRPERNIILDIGSGSGQSTEAFTKLPGCSFILVEPDEIACQSLCKRIGIKDYHKDPRSVIGVVPQLTKGTRRYHVLNCRLETIMGDSATMLGLKGAVKCAISCFSAHYVSHIVDYLVSKDIPFIGCYYSYEGIAPGESIIETSGIQMKRISHFKAEVKWGNDEPYEEPVVLPEEEPMEVTFIGALDVVPIDTSLNEKIMQKVCSAVKIMVSR